MLRVLLRARTHMVPTCPPPLASRCAQGCLRPTARAAHGTDYEPADFWYRENLCVCAACYCAGLAEDRTGHAAALDRLSDMADGWRTSEYHKYLSFAGAQCRRSAACDARDALGRALDAQRTAHRARGEEARRQAVAQRASAAAAATELRAERAARRRAAQEERAQRAYEAHAVREQRAQHAAASVAEVQLRVEAGPELCAA